MGQKMYHGYSTVGSDMLEKRKIVLARKQPRRIYVQSNTKITGEIFSVFYICWSVKIRHTIYH